MNSKKEKYLPFFVYGTLLKGHPNFIRRIEVLKQDVQVDKATLEGYSLARNQPMPFYPYMVDNKTIPDYLRPAIFQPVQGELIHIHWDEYTAALASLDHLEGVPHHYERREVIVNRKKGGPAEAWAYVLPDRNAKEMFFKPLIDGNSWEMFVKENKIYTIHTGQKEKAA